MSESLLSQTVLAYSTTPESTYGTPQSLVASGYTPTVTRARALPVPYSDKTDDRGVIGRGNAMYPSYQRSGFRVPVAFEISDMVQVGSVAPLIRRFMGATAGTPATVEAAIAFKHTFNELDPNTGGLQLPASSWVYSLNEFDHLLTGGCGSTIQLAQQGAADPTYTISQVTSGFSKRLSTISGPAFGTLAVPGAEPYMYGADSAVQYTNEASATVSLTTPSHKMRSVTFNANNNLDTGDTRAGMPAISSTQPERGWYRDFLNFGDRDISADFTMSMDGDYSLKDAEELNTVYTNFKWTMNGTLIPTTATSSRYQMIVTIPKFNLRTPSAGEANNKSTKTFTIFPLTHSAFYGVYKIEIVNGVATAIA